MRTVVQRVRCASVAVGGEVVSSIGVGLLALVGIEVDDGRSDAEWTAEKLAHLRVFEDGAGKMNLSVLDVRGSLLLVPNFTLAGDATKGRRPGFDRAMKPEQAGPLFEVLSGLAAGHGAPVGRGVFRAEMAVSLVNDGPVTLVLQSPRTREGS
ncbi:MAG: D-tyrosyl-tRNA(Tyr) deacylase [Phycisphaerales bacterium]|nr:D-tyrosyl-tRNA(Tyr) deacylase [Phycisphaerales bacterium]